MVSLRSVRTGFLSPRFWKTAALGSGFAALIAQATSSDRSYANSAGLLNNFTTGQKLQQYVNWMVSRVTNGYVPSVFSNVYNGNKPSWNVANVLNQYTGAGIAAWLYGHFGNAKGLHLPFNTTVKKFGTPLIAGGIIGGLLDDPAGQVKQGLTSGLNVRGGVISGAIYRGGGAQGGQTNSNLNSR